MDAVVRIFAEYGAPGLILVCRWGRSRSCFSGRGIRFCRDITNFQPYTTYRVVGGSLLQFGYRFRRKTTRGLLPHPDLLAG